MNLKTQQGLRFSDPVSYEEYGVVQRHVAKKLSRCLPDANPKRILEIGCGSGFLTRLLLDEYPEAEITALDISKQMIDFAATRHGAAHIEWEHVDFSDYLSSEPFDLIVSSSSLHWLPDLTAAFSKIKSLLSEGGQCIFASMLKDTFFELQQCRAMVVPEYKPRVVLPLMDEFITAIKNAELCVDFTQQEKEEITYQHGNEFLKVINRMGVAGTAPKKEILNLSQLIKLAKLYEQYFTTPEGRIKVSYEIGYVRLVNITQ